MTVATVTKRLRAEGLPVELVRGPGYHYWIFDDGKRYECHSEMVYRFRDITEAGWLQRGRDYCADVERRTDPDGILRPAIG